MFPIHSHSHSPAQPTDFSAALDGALTESPPNADMPSVQLTDLPPELIEQVAEHLPTRDVLALACAHPRRFGPAADTLVRKRVNPEAQTAESGAQVEDVLAAIGRLAPADRKRPLLKLERSVVMLPRDERSAARAQIRRVAAGMDEAVRSSLDTRRRISAHNSPNAAVLAGEPIEAVLDVLETCRERRGEETSPEWREGCTDLLSCLVMDSAYAAIDGVENVRAVARRHGIQGHLIGELERSAVVGPAAEWILRGRGVDETMRRFGLRDRGSRRWLTGLHLHRELDAGKTVQQIVDHHDKLSLPLRSRSVILAAMGHARCKIRSGRDDVAELANQIGIQDAERIHALKSFAAITRISAGADLRETARRFDQEGASDYRKLSWSAVFNCRSILEQVLDGEDVHDVAERHGILPDHEGLLAWMAARLPPPRASAPPATSFEGYRETLRERVRQGRQGNESDNVIHRLGERYWALRDTLEARFDAPSSAPADRAPTP